jgi:hypothetical protein
LVVGIVRTDASLLRFATAGIPASLATSAAVFGVETWADTRAAAIDQKSREALERFIATAAAVISGHLNLNGVEVPMRANAATWGSPALLSKLAERTRFIDSIGTEYGEEIKTTRERAKDPLATVTINLGYRKAQLARLTAEAVALARVDIGLPAVSPAVVYGVLYGTVDGLSFDQIPPVGVQNYSRTDLA